MICRRVVVVFSILTCIGLSGNVVAKELPPAVRKFERITVKLSDELTRLDPILQKALGGRNFRKSNALLLLQKNTNHASTVLYDTMSFLILYDGLELSCKGEAARIINNRLLYARDTLTLIRTDLIEDQKYYSNMGFDEISNAHGRIAEHISQALKILDNLTAFMREPASRPDQRKHDTAPPRLTSSRQLLAPPSTSRRFKLRLPP